MLPIGTKRTWQGRQLMSAFGGKADIYRVRLGQQERGLRHPVVLYCEIIKQRCIYGVGSSNQKQRVTIRSSARDRFSGEIAARAGPVLNDELLSKTFRQPLTENTCNDVRCTACRKPDDDTHRPRRIGLCPCDAR
jgi:hypothetical protein